MIKQIWPEYSFGQGEHPPSSKFNAIFSVLEESRKFTGPFSISQIGATGVTYVPTATSIYIQLDDDPWTVGGVDTGTTPPQTIRNFTAHYYNGIESLQSGFIRWDSLIFVSGTIESKEKWYVQLTSSNTAWGTVGLGGILISGSSFNVSSLSFYRMSGGV